MAFNLTAQDIEVKGWLSMTLFDLCKALRNSTVSVAVTEVEGKVRIRGGC